MLKKRVACLLAAVMLCTPAAASVMPIREVAQQVGAQVEYDSNSKIITFKAENTTLTLDLNTNSIKDSRGYVVAGAKVYSKDGITYVESTDIVKQVNKANTEFAIKQYLSKLSESVVDVVYKVAVEAEKEAQKQAVAEKEVTKKEESKSSDDSIVNRNTAYATTTAPTTMAKYEIVGLHVKDVYVVPAIYEQATRENVRKPMSERLIRQGYVTTSTNYQAESCIWIYAKIKCNTVDKGGLFLDSSFGQAYTKYVIEPDGYISLGILKRNDISAGWVYVWVCVNSSKGHFEKEYYLDYGEYGTNNTVHIGDESFKDESEEILNQYAKAGINLCVYQ